MTAQWFTGLTVVTFAGLLVGPAIAQTGSGSGTPGPTNPQPAPSANQPGAPSVGAPGKATPSAQPGAGQTGAQPGAGQAGSDASKPMATNGQSDAVKSVQKALQEKGLDPGPIDGVMGPKTQGALRAYQKDQKLPVTGQLDPETREKLGVAR